MASTSSSSSSSSSPNDKQQQQQQPSLISGHAKLAQGAIVSTLGTLTNSKPWTDSGTSTREDGIREMKMASENRDANNAGYGKIEEVAGRVTGCEGMEREGKGGK